MLSSHLLFHSSMEQHAKKMRLAFVTFLHSSFQTKNKGAEIEKWKEKLKRERERDRVWVHTHKVDDSWVDWPDLCDRNLKMKSRTSHLQITPSTPLATWLFYWDESNAQVSLHSLRSHTWNWFYSSLLFVISRADAATADALAPDRWWDLLSLLHDTLQ